LVWLGCCLCCVCVAWVVCHVCWCVYVVVGDMGLALWVGVALPCALSSRLAGYVCWSRLCNGCWVVEYTGLTGCWRWTIVCVTPQVAAHTLGG
jgi:hypothetical protein